MAASHFGRHDGDRYVSAQRKFRADLQIPESAEIRIATPADKAFIDSTQKKFGNALGFLPHAAIERLLEIPSTWIARENGESAGYIISRPSLRWQPGLRSVTQACVAMDAQRRHHGLALLATIEQTAIAQGMQALQACCALGLESNEFWRAAGFIPICHMTPENKRKREIICWRRPLATKIPAWFAMPPRLAGHMARRPNLNRDPHRSTDALATAIRYTTTQAG